MRRHGGLTHWAVLHENSCGEVYRAENAVLASTDSALQTSALSTPHNKNKTTTHLGGCLRESAGARTRDPNIKSVVLYLLSYGFIVPNWNISVFGGANVGIIFVIAKFILLLSLMCALFCLCCLDFFTMECFFLSFLCDI